MTISFCITPQTFKVNYLSYAAKLGIDIFKKWKWWSQDLCIKKKNKERRNSPDSFCIRNSWNCPKVAFYHLSEFLFLLRVNTMSRDYNGGWELGLGEKAFRGFLDFDGFLRIYVEKFNNIKTPETEYINQNFITSSDIFQNINLYIKKFRIWSFSGPHFPTFELNKERYSFSFRIQPECGNIRTRKTPNTDIFHKL